MALSLISRPKRSEHDSPRQRKVQARVRRAKVWLQFAIGTGLVAALIGQLVFEFFRPEIGIPAAEQIGRQALGIIGAALVLSAGVELAYMLFTPGPDEAIEPVILSLAATIFVVVSKDGLGLEQAGAVFALTVAIGALFFIRAVFIASDDPAAAPEEGEA